MSRYEISLLESLASMEQDLAEQEGERVEQAETVGEVRVLLWTVVGMSVAAIGAAAVWAWCKIKKVSSPWGKIRGNIDEPCFCFAEGGHEAQTEPVRTRFRPGAGRGGAARDRRWCGSEQATPEAVVYRLQ